MIIKYEYLAEARVQILDEAICIYRNINTLEQDIDPTIFRSYWYIVGRTNYFTLARRQDEKENFVFKLDVLLLEDNL